MAQQQDITNRTATPEIALHEKFNSLGLEVSDDLVQKLVQKATDEVRLKQLIEMLPAYVTQYEKQMSTGLIIAGMCTDYDRKDDVDQEDDPEPQTGGNDNCFPHSFKVNFKEPPNMFVDVKSSGSP